MKSKLLALLSVAVLVSACEAPPTDDGLGATGVPSGGAGYGAGMDSGGGVSTGGASTGDPGELANTIGDRVFFAYDSAVLTSQAQATLQRQAAWLQQYPYVNVVVEGHCDERGTREYNLALGERRASAARNYLVNLGVAPSRITTVSYGKERPAVLGSNPEAWAQNRRSVTVVSY